ncbi:MAG: DnaJ domain-containing protein [Myxococcales bacterium]|nr:DnaJ domain-containing protein [Myxococcales bacterium]
MSEPDFYKVLGVSKTADAPQIKAAYRKLARELHPDRNPGNKSAEDRFKQVSRAYEVLADPKKRKLFDEFGEVGLKEGFDPEQMRQYQRWGGGANVPREGGFQWSGNLEDLLRGAGGSGGGSVGDISDIFGNFTGRAGRRQPRSMPGRDIETSITLPFMEAIRGGEKDVSFQDPGTGRPKRLRIRVPAGIEDGHTLRLRGQGLEGTNGGPPGDLMVKVDIGPHPFLWREGRELHMKVPVTVPEAWRGAKVLVPTPQGEVSLRIPPATQGGAILRLKGKGITFGRGKTGDLFAHIQIGIPKDTSHAEGITDAIAALEKAYDHDIRAALKL